MVAPRRSDDTHRKRLLYKALAIVHVISIAVAYTIFGAMYLIYPRTTWPGAEQNLAELAVAVFSATALLSGLGLAVANLRVFERVALLASVVAAILLLLVMTLRVRASQDGCIRSTDAAAGSELCGPAFPRVPLTPTLSRRERGTMIANAPMKHLP